MDPTTNDGPARWLPGEMRLINLTELFRNKPAIMKKAEGYLNGLKTAMTAELAQGAYPAGADLVKGQIARGENLDGFPFISLDIPQLFAKTEFFTYRTLFWWGHYLGFALILKGGKLPDYADRLIANKARLETMPDVYLSVAPTAWEWEVSDANFKNPRRMTGREIQETVASLQYMKLCRFYPVGGKNFDSLDWASAGVATFRDLTGLTAG